MPPLMAKIEGAQGVVDRLCESSRATQIEIIVIERERLGQQGFVDAADGVVVLPFSRSLSMAEQTDQRDRSFRGRDKLSELGIEGTVGFGSGRIEKPGRPEAPRAKALVDDMAQHGQQRRYTNASR